MLRSVIYNKIKDGAPYRYTYIIIITLDRFRFGRSKFRIRDLPAGATSTEVQLMRPAQVVSRRIYV